MIGKGKRPRDPNQLAAWTVAMSTGQIPAPEQEPKPKPDRSDRFTWGAGDFEIIETKPRKTKPAKVPMPANVSEYMAAIGRKGGQIGGKRRLKTMTKAERSKIAAKAAKARWKQAKAKRPR
jgi:hypothetical protein